MVHQVDVRPLDGEVVEALGEHVVDQIGDCTGDLDAGRAAADDDDVERTLVDAGRIGVRILEHLEDPRTESAGVDDGVERERVLLGSGCVEEVRAGAGRQHQVVARPTGAGRAGRSARLDIDRGDLGFLHRDVLVTAEDATKRTGHVVVGQLGGRDLVEQRLELVVVVPVEECHLDVVVGQSQRAADAGEASSDDHDVRPVGGVVAHPALLIQRQRSCHHPQRARSQAVRSVTELQHRPRFGFRAPWRTGAVRGRAENPRADRRFGFSGTMAYPGGTWACRESRAERGSGSGTGVPGWIVGCRGSRVDAAGSYSPLVSAMRWSTPGGEWVRAQRPTAIQKRLRGGCMSDQRDDRAGGERSDRGGVARGRREICARASIDVTSRCSSGRSIRTPR